MKKYLKNNFASHNKSRISYVILFIILILGVYLRIGGALSGSFAFTYDVGRDMLQMQDIVDNHKIPLIGQTSGLGGLFYGPWWYYILTPAFIISAGNPQGVALFMVLIGISTIFMGFILGKKIQGYTLGLILAAFLSISDTLVGYSTQIWNPNMAPLLVILFFTFFLLPAKKRTTDWIGAFFSGIVLGLILDSEIVFGVLFIAGIGIFSLSAFRHSIFKKRSLFIVLGFIFTLLPRLLFEFRHGFVMTRSLGSISGEQSVLNVSDFFKVLPERFIVFLNLFSDTFGIPSIVTAIFCAVIIMVFIASWKAIHKIERSIIILNGIILMTFLVGSSFFARAIWGHYLVGIPIIYVIIIGMFFSIVIKKYRYLGIVLCVILIFTSSKPAQVLSNFQNPNWEGNAAVYRNQVAVIDYIYKNADGKKFNYTAYTPSVHDYPYRYLFSWYGMSKYGYTPDTDAQKQLYMILEPDPGYEGRITDWLKIREGDGKIINEKIIKGGIKVQIRKR